jgi:undecaprenyl-diphosphatase
MGARRAFLSELAKAERRDLAVCSPWRTGQGDMGEKTPFSISVIATLVAASQWTRGNTSAGDVEKSARGSTLLVIAARVAVIQGTRGTSPRVTVKVRGSGVLAMAAFHSDLTQRHLALAFPQYPKGLDMSTAQRPSSAATPPAPSASRWLPRRWPELSVLLLLVLLAGGIWLFMALADAVTEGETHGLDKTILMAFRDPVDPLRPLGPRWLTEAMRDLTALGSFLVLGFLTLAAAGYLCFRRLFGLSALVAAAAGGGMALSAALKSLFERQRPELIPHDMALHTSSFPSQHSMMGAIVYLTLAALLARTQPTRGLRVYLLLLAVALSVGIGFSRVYLGVHWPSDVLAGWSAGAAWAIFCWLIARRLHLDGDVEAEEDRSEAPPSAARR